MSGAFTPGFVSAGLGDIFWCRAAPEEAVVAEFQTGKWQNRTTGFSVFGCKTTFPAAERKRGGPPPPKSFGGPPRADKEITRGWFRRFVVIQSGGFGRSGHAVQSVQMITSSAFRAPHRRTWRNNRNPPRPRGVEIPISVGAVIKSRLRPGHGPFLDSGKIRRLGETLRGFRFIQGGSGAGRPWKRTIR